MIHFEDFNLTPIPGKADDIGLSPAEFRVLFHLLKFARDNRDNKDAEFTSETIAEKCKMVVSQVDNAIRSLKRRKIIEMIKTKEGKRTVARMSLTSASKWK